MKNYSIFLLILFFNLSSQSMYFCTAANSQYFKRLVNLIGSIHATNYEKTKEIAVFNLGLTTEQKKILTLIDKVQLYEIEITNPDLLKNFIINSGDKTVPGWYAWKPVAIKQSLEMFPYVLWVDAGTTILKPLDDLFEYINQKGYFLATIGDGPINGKCKHNVAWQTTKFVRSYFKLDLPKNRWILEKESLMAGVIGISQQYQDLFIIPLYQLTKNLRFFEDDDSTPEGFGTARYEQALLTIIAYLNGLNVFEQDHTQKKPILLSFNQKSSPFYITWHSKFVCEKTHIYSSRGDIKNLNYYQNQLYFKSK